MLLVRKIVSYVIDYLLAFVFVRFYTFCSSVFWQEETTKNYAIIMVLSALITLMFLTCYIPTKLKGQTLGQKLMKIKVINMNGQERTYVQSFIRECVVKVSFAPLFIVSCVLYFIVTLVAQKSICDIFPHDMLLKTKVIPVK